MFVVGPLPEPFAPQFLAVLDGIETATIGHFREAGFLAPEIRPLAPEHRAAGLALTVSLPGDDGTAMVHALSLARPGDILVVDRLGDRRHACWGAVTTAAARAAGVVGVIVDGYVTDLAAIRASGFPVWCRGTSPVTTKRRDLGGGISIPISCGGAVVRPGDVVLADESGVCILPAAEMVAVAQRARSMQEAEPATIARLERGEKLGDITGASAVVGQNLA